MLSVDIISVQSENYSKRIAVDTEMKSVIALSASATPRLYRYTFCDTNSQ